MTLKSILIALLLAAGPATGASAQGAVFLVRHAERADAVSGGPPMMATDPSLSDAGRMRAESLATLLKDAGITAIYVTEFKRTKETATPLATALGISLTTVPAKETAALVEKLTNTGSNVLVVGHSNTVPDVVKGLGVAAPLSIGDAEYDNLLIVTASPQRQLIRLRYR